MFFMPDEWRTIRARKMPTLLAFIASFVHEISNHLPQWLWFRFRLPDAPVAHRAHAACTAGPA